ncbi:MAG: hypothetical protein QNJ65_22070 [Xenococcaceae cyanobacterium MO_234.B1]|nr:hypothetical protein [Xenococcaceae cyanobacterium MO_234.B1]
MDLLGAYLKITEGLLSAQLFLARGTLLRKQLAQPCRWDESQGRGQAKWS